MFGFYEKKRSKLLEKLTRNIGEVRESEDEIEVHVIQEKLDEIYVDEKENFKITKQGLFNEDRVTKRQLKKYGLDKPVKYIFEGIELKKRIIVNEEIEAMNFKDCNFSSFLSFKGVKNLRFENNRYSRYLVSEYIGFTTFFEVNEAKNIEFVNEDIITNYEEQRKFAKIMSIKALEVEISNSKINTVYINTNGLKVNSSIIKMANSSEIKHQEQVDSQIIEVNATLVSGVIDKNIFAETLKEKEDDENKHKRVSIYDNGEKTKENDEER